jgi:phenylalanyl-tRNA synthetase beta chain
MLIKELSGAKVASEIEDFYPKPIDGHLVELSYQNLDRLVGQHIDKKVVKAILTNLEIEILNETKEGLRLNVPAYRVDVSREVDVIEEVLRIYGYNRVNLPELMKTSMLTSDKHQPHKLENIIANQLSADGFSEIFNNSLTNPEYYSNQDDLVNMLNPLSRETEVMRKDMLFEGLNAMAFNHNRKRKNLKFYEFGKTYRSLGESKFEETKRLAIWLSGDQNEESWLEKTQATDFFELKAYAQKCLQRLGVLRYKEKNTETEGYWAYTYHFLKGKTVLAELGEVSPKTLKDFDIKVPVFYAQFNWDAVLSCMPTQEIKHKAVGKFPAVRRDLALLIDTKVSFDAIKRLARETEKRLLKEVNLFDVYEGKNLEEGKKSYGVSFTFQDESKTLTDKQIDKVMERLIGSLKKEMGAELR